VASAPTHAYGRDAVTQTTQDSYDTDGSDRMRMGRIGPVRAEHAIDEARLRDYLAAHLPGAGGALVVRQFDSGQSNPTYLLELGGRGYVLRKKPPGQLLSSAHAVEREFRVMRALEGSDVPVPRCHLLCEEEAVIGTPFFVMDRVEGRVLRDPLLPGIARAGRRPIAEALVDTLARLHAVDWRARGLADFGRHCGYVTRQIVRWTKQYRATETDTVPEMDRLIAWLPEHNPEDPEDASRTTLVHGDFRMDNTILHPQRAEVLAVIDWELSTLGHPFSDLAYFLMLYDFPADDEAFPGLAGADLAGLGLPSSEDLVQAYAARSGRDPGPALDFFLAFSMFRMAAILQGVYARGLQGNASATNAQTMGPRAVAFARLGWRRAQAARGR
jgi:aminoglycoside phosphotransferase (APT) family kinase protein